MRIVWSPLALNRVAEIAQRIAEDRPNATREWIGAVWRLESFPRSGPTVPEAERRSDLREVVHGDYRIIYCVDPERILILTVRHARQETAPGLSQDSA